MQLLSMIVRQYCAASAVWAVALSSHGAVNPSGRIGWTQTLGSGLSWYGYDTMAVDRDGGIIVGGTADSPPQVSNVRKEPFVWRLNRAGSVDWTSALSRTFDGKAEGSALVSEHVRVGVAENGDIFAVVDFEEQKPWFVLLSRSGQQRITKPIFGDKRVTLTKIVPGDEHHQLLVGIDEAAEPILAKINHQGELAAWEVNQAVRPEGRMPIDAARTETGGVVVLWSRLPWALGRSEGSGPAILVKYNADGRLEAEHRLERECYALSVDRNGEYRLACQEEKAASGTSIMALDAEFKYRWTRPVSPEIGSTMFAPRITSMPSRTGFAVAAGISRKPYVAQFSDVADEKWHFLGEGLPPSAFYDLIATPWGSLIMASTIHIDDGTGFRSRIRLMEFPEQ